MVLLRVSPWLVRWFIYVLFKQLGGTNLSYFDVNVYPVCYEFLQKGVDNELINNFHVMTYAHMDGRYIVVHVL